MAIRVFAATLLVIWFVLVLLGKGGFVHIILLVGISAAVIGALSIYRSRMTE